MYQGRKLLNCLILFLRERICHICKKRTAVNNLVNTNPRNGIILFKTHLCSVNTKNEPDDSYEAPALCQQIKHRLPLITVVWLNNTNPQL